jgi:hypothetical protein
MEFTTHISTVLPNSATLRTGALVVSGGKYGTITLCGAVFQQTSLPTPSGFRPQNYNSDSPKAARFGLELFPLHSQLLRDSWLVSFPPGIDMLKSPG